MKRVASGSSSRMGRTGVPGEGTQGMGELGALLEAECREKR